MTVLQCALDGEGMPDDDCEEWDWAFEYNVVRGTRAHDLMHFAAAEFAEYAWNNHDMWETGDSGFDVWVRKRGEPHTAKKFNIEVRAVPEFWATESPSGV